jgi:signal transduction histidine kinase
MIAELAGAAAHELNQPLTSVLGYAELIRRRLQRAEPKAERSSSPPSSRQSGEIDPLQNAANVIVTEAERMAEIVRKIGKITRYETKSYVGAAKILDLDRSSEEDPKRAVR